MSVYPKEGGPYSLYCDVCHCWVPNTANVEMRKEGCFAHSHVCGSLNNGEVPDEAYAAELASKTIEKPPTDAVLEKIERMIENLNHAMQFESKWQESSMRRLKELVSAATAAEIAHGGLDGTIEDIRKAAAKIQSLQDQIGALQSFSRWYKDNGYPEGM